MARVRTSALLLVFLANLGASGEISGYYAVASDTAPIGGSAVSARGLDESASSVAPTADEASASGEVDVASGATRSASLDREPGKSLSEIVVTPRKRSELIQDAPVSVVALTGERLAARNIRRLDEIGQAVAGLKLDSVVGSNTDARIYLRGVGQDSASTALDPGVGLYVDGVYLPRLTGSLLALDDIDRVEVVRGPQGTLFGKNTIGGVINVITRKPQATFGSEAAVRVGNGGRLDTNVNVTGPLAARVYGRLSLASRTSDGFTRSQVEGERGGDDKLLAGRGQLQLLPNEDLEINLMFEQQRQFEKLPLSKCRVRPAIALSSFVADNTTMLREACVQSATGTGDLTSTSENIPKQYQDIIGSTMTVEWDLGAFSVKSTSSYRDIKTRLRAGDADGIGVDLAQIQGGRSDLRTLSQELLATGVGLRGRLAWTLGAYALQEDGDGRASALIQPSLVTDPEAAALVGRPQILLGGVPLDDVQLSALLNATSPGIITGALDTFGELSRVTEPLLATLSLNAGAQPVTLLELVKASNSRTVSEFETRSFAGFGETTYSVTDAFKLTGGLRYTVERKERDASVFPLVPFPKLIGMPNIGDERSERFDRWTGRAIASYAWNEDLLTYLSFSRGFRSGGFNEPAETGVMIGSGLANPVGDKYDTEVLDSLELGVKSTWFDDRLLLNLSAFYNEYDDIQLQRLTLGSTGLLNSVIENAAEATVQGVEVDWEARPSSMQGLILSGGFSLVEARYDEFTTDKVREVASECGSLRLSECPFDLADLVAPNAAAATSGFGRAILNAANPVIDRAVDVSNLEFKQTPAFSFNVQARYLFDLERLGVTWGLLDASLEWYHQGKTFQDTFNTEGAEQSKFGLLNGRFSWDLPDGSTTVGLWGRNLLDRRYVTGAVDLRNISGTSTVFFGEPRTYGIEVRRVF